MYKYSTDTRFLVVKDRIQRAYLQLVVEKGFQRVTVSDIARRAQINRMTFYDHYETVDDVFAEFLEDDEKKMLAAFEQEEPVTIDQFFSLLNNLLISDMEFYRFAAKEEACTPLRNDFRNLTAKMILQGGVKEITVPKYDPEIYASLISALIAYAYFDWLAGKYGDVSLRRVIDIVKSMILSINKS